MSRQQLSTGIAALDGILGGKGVKYGSVTLLVEDEFNIYADLICRYFVAQGIAASDQSQVAFMRQVGNHHSEEADIKWIGKLPAWKGMSDDNSSKISLSMADLPFELASDKDNNSAMKIAWRYNKNSKKNMDDVDTNEDLPQEPNPVNFQRGSLKSSWANKATSVRFQEPSTAPSDHDLNAMPSKIFDLSRKISLAALKNCEPRLSADYCISPDTSFNSCLDNVSQLLSQSPTNQMRLCIQSVSSFHWNTKSVDRWTALVRFIYHLKNLVSQHPSASCLLTVPASVMCDSDRSGVYTALSPRGTRLLHSLDNALWIKSFAESSPYAQEYHGMIAVLKRPKGVVYHGEYMATEWGFKCRRRKFCLEPLYLPPDLGDGNEQDSKSTAPKEQDW